MMKLFPKTTKSLSINNPKKEYLALLKQNYTSSVEVMLKIELAYNTNLKIIRKLYERYNNSSLVKFLKTNNHKLFEQAKELDALSSGDRWKTKPSEISNDTYVKQMNNILLYLSILGDTAKKYGTSKPDDEIIDYLYSIRKASFGLANQYYMAEHKKKKIEYNIRKELLKNAKKTRKLKYSELLVLNSYNTIINTIDCKVQYFAAFLDNNSTTTLLDKFSATYLANKRAYYESLNYSRSQIEQLLMAERYYGNDWFVNYVPFDIPTNKFMSLIGIVEGVGRDNLSEVEDYDYIPNLVARLGHEQMKSLALFVNKVSDEGGLLSIEELENFIYKLEPYRGSEFPFYDIAKEIADSLVLKKEITKEARDIEEIASTTQELEATTPTEKETVEEIEAYQPDIPDLEPEPDFGTNFDMPDIPEMPDLDFLEPPNNSNLQPAMEEMEDFVR